MSYENHRIIPFRGNFLDVLKQVSKEGLLVDIVLNHVPGAQEYRDIIFKESLGTRIIHVGENYIIIGPKRPLSNCIIPIEEILLVRLSEEERRDDEDLIDEKIERSHQGWEPKWARGEETRSLSPDGLMHYVENAHLEDLPHDTVTVILVNDDSNNSKKLSKFLSKLAKEYDSDALFIQSEASKQLQAYYKINKTPAIVVSFGNKIQRIIEGLASKGDYRTAVVNALAKYRSSVYY